MSQFFNHGHHSAQAMPYTYTHVRVYAYITQYIFLIAHGLDCLRARIQLSNNTFQFVSRLIHEGTKVRSTRVIPQKARGK